jgi:hypothetical protein
MMLADEAKLRVGIINMKPISAPAFNNFESIFHRIHNFHMGSREENNFVPAKQKWHTRNFTK